MTAVGTADSAARAPATAVMAWRPVVSGRRREEAIAVALDVVGRCSDPARVEAAVHAMQTQTAFPRGAAWRRHDLAQGEVGLALLFGMVDRCVPDAGWDRVAHRSLAAGATEATARLARPALFSGLAGLAFVTATLRRGGERYRRLAAAIDEVLVPSTHALAQTVHGRRDGLGVDELDVVSGLAGIAGHLLAHRRSAAEGAAAKHAVEALVALTGPSPGGPPRWWTPPATMFDAATAARYPAGSLNCGLAHGLPGPLAVMAMAHCAGAPIDGLTAAIRTSAQWLVEHRQDDQWGVNWPAMVSVDDDVAFQAPSRAAWCYGSPGVARSLWLAGSAIDDAELRDLAVEALLAVHRRPVAARNIDSPTFCHGIAGLLQITLRFAVDTGRADLADAAGALVDRLLAAHEPDRSILGFRDVEPGGGRVDHPGLLDGAPGVALVLLAAAFPVEPAWDRMFLLA